jgi:hypothetical protein
MTHPPDGLVPRDVEEHARRLEATGVPLTGATAGAAEAAANQASGVFCEGVEEEPEG